MRLSRFSKWDFRIGAVLLFTTVGIFQGCTINDASSVSEATIRSHFFPLDNGIVYTYGRFNHTRYDTLTCRLVIGQPPSMKNVFINSATGLPFYYIGLTRDANGNFTAATLSTDTSTLIALEGKLEPNATWVADEINGIHATVVEQYDDYYLPERKEDFADVLAVEYHQDGQPPGNYTLRFFARDKGLILERQFVGPGTEIASLQLISIQYPS